MEKLTAPFSDPAVVAKYTEGPPRFVPGFADLHKMTAILLAERTSPSGRVLVLGAGGGLEIKALADAQPGWTFDGVDPAAPMLELARHTLGPRMERVQLQEGYIDDAPSGPFDAAVCLLTLHFLERTERRRTAAALRKRLKPGAPFVVAHASFPQGPEAQPRWLSRYAAFAVASGNDPALTEKAKATVAANLHLYTPEEDAAILSDAGFNDVTLFYAAFTWRGWVAYA